MKLQVFGCPSCQQPFQVPESQAGQVVQCPSCSQSVQIPADTFAEVQPPPDEQQVFTCPNCSGQFGVTSSMFGQQVGCPHCQSSILVQSPTQPLDSVEGPVIVTDPSVGKRKKTSTKRWKSPVKPEASKDLFAPGFEKPKSPSPSERQPGSQPDPKLPPTSDPKPESKSAPKPAQKSGPKPAPKPPTQPERKSVPPKPTRSQSTPPKDSQSASRKPLIDTPLPPRKKKEARFKTKPKPKNTVPSPVVAPPSERIIVPPPPPKETKSVARTSPAKVVGDEAIADEVVAAKVVNSEVVSSEVVDGLETAVNSEVDAGSEKAQPDAINLPDAINQPDPIDHLLPPRFDVLDPSRLRFNSGRDSLVFLPDGKGGTRQIDQRVMRVEHDGEKVSLVVMNEKEKQRRRLIQNIIAIVIGIAIMWLAFQILR